MQVVGLWVDYSPDTTVWSRDFRGFCKYFGKKKKFYYANPYRLQ